MKIVAVGDVSFRNGDKENTKMTFKNIKKQNPSPDLVLVLGDLFYTKKPDDFLDEVSGDDVNGIDEKKIRPLIGNHDDDDEGKLDSKEAKAFWKLLIDRCLKNENGIGLVPLEPSENNPEDKERYYSFTTGTAETTGKICFIILYTHTEFVDKEKQKEFAFQKLLKASSDPEIDWIIVCYHKPSVTSETDGGHPAESGCAKIYHEIFDHFGVDLILTGHNHNYQRTKLVKNNPGNETEPKVVDDVDNNVYDTRKGTIFMIIGSGGREAEHFVKKAERKEKFMKFRNPEGDEDEVKDLPDDEKYGILSLDFLTNKKMTGKFITNGGKIIDSFTIDKSSITGSHECGEHEHWNEATQSCVHDDSFGFERDKDNEEKISCIRKDTEPPT
jgi:predicted phosphodiesterase